MTYKTRKHIWLVPLVASIAIIGVLAAFVVLANNPGVATAQAGDPCAGMTEEQRGDFILGGGECGEPNQPPVAQAPPELDPIEGLMVTDADGNSVPNTAVVADIAQYFSDPEGDELSFAAGSSKPEVATVTLNENGDLVITAHRAGETVITVTATDADGSGMSVPLEIAVTGRAVAGGAVSLVAHG